jgi:hypothetical protein
MQSKVMTRKPSGRVSPHKGRAVPAASAAQPAQPAAQPAQPDKARSERWDVQQSRQVRSGWVWRGFLILTLLGVGVAIIMAGNHHRTLALLWLVIAAGWFAMSMWLWRQHSRYMRGDQK